LPIQKFALERLDDGIDLPARTILILQKILDAVPLSHTVKIASTSLVEKFTVLLAHIFTVSFTVFYFHVTSIYPNNTFHHDHPATLSTTSTRRNGTAQENSEQLAAV
jgi:hypothetical protein